KEGKTLTWAVRFEDYSYEDDQAGLEATFTRAMLLIEAQIGNPQKGIILLPYSSTAKPNMSIRKAVEGKGYTVMTLNEFLAAYNSTNSDNTASNSSQNLVLNKGEAIGYIKYIPSGKEASINGNYKDILVYETLPHRVPIAGGILTLEPQTPLSHINLLAKNRGTPNAVVLSKTDQQKLKSMHGKIVKIRLGKTNEVQITPSTIGVAQAFWNNRPQLKVQVPKMDLSVKSISYFDIGSKSVQKVNCIGSKAANYALLQHNLPKYVRKGFGVPFYFYDKMLKDAAVDDLIANLIRDEKKLSVWSRNQRLKAIQEKILAAKVDPRLLREIKSISLKYYKGKRIRLRSSTNCEDLPEFNGAGLYKSKGFWEYDNLEVIEQKVLKVYASLWSPMAYEERSFFGIDHQQVGMAILINEAFREEHANGVVLTVPNTDGSMSIHINSQSGENSVTNAESGQIPEAIFFRKEDSKWYVTNTKSSIQNIFIEEPKLTPLVRELQRATVDISYLLKKDLASSKQNTYGVDLEFKVMKDQNEYKLYIKQARLLQLGL
ncbi:MAG: PEP/pyruvate-binding domain-containing protein, partial [Saprospiraceae bacterium]|nr:PEP/pyruvate-binding domain-containing protein [Saprospiraceae bacterium]